MDSVVVTFLKYLEDSSKRLEQGIILRASKTGRRELNSEDERDLLRISERKNLSRILQVPKEEWDLHGEIFIQFDYLSEMLEESPLNARGKFAILQRLLEKNLATNIIHQDARCFDIQKIDDYFSAVAPADIGTNFYAKISSDLGKNLSLSGDNVIQIKILDMYGTTGLTVGVIEGVSLELKSTFNQESAYYGKIDFTYTPVGNVTKKVYFVIDEDYENAKTEIVRSSNELQTYEIYGLSHGAHTLRVYFEATIGTQTVSSNQLFYDIIFGRRRL